MTTPPDRDLRHHVAAATMGSSIIMLDVQQCFDDIVGGVEAKQWGLVVFQTRVLVSSCLHVCGLVHGAQPVADNDALSADPFDEVPDALTAAGLDLLAVACALPDSGAAPWLQRLRTFVHDTEDLLGLDDPLPALKSPNGMFGAVRLVRGWVPLAEELGLPSMLPPEWLSTP